MEIAALVGYHINKQYKIGKKLGAGAFGEIYQADQGNQSFAVKIEKSDTKHPQLQFEFKLYQYLNLHQAIGIPKVYGLYNENGFTFLVMELLGKSLEDIFTDSDRRFSLQTVSVMGLQMLECIEFLHVKQFLHRDIKPDNFLMGRQHYDRVYMVDFGLAKRYITKDTHIAYKENKALTGTARYASINTHLGIEQSRRDDLESLGYVLMYFLRGQLPWQNLKANTQREKYERIMEKKLATSSQALCRGYPQQLCDFIEYSKNLKFDDKPDYRMLKQLFSSMMKENQLRMEYFYDWDDEDTQREKLIIEDRLPTLPKEKKSTSIGSIGRTILKTNQNQIQNHINISTIQVRPSNKLSGARQILRKHSSMHKS